MKEIYEINGRTVVRTINTKPSLTDQSQAAACDINNIMAQYKKTGQITHIAKNQGVYADLSDIPSYQDALNTVIQAESAFAALPSTLRKRFSNDPKELLEFLNDPSNLDEGLTLGLLQPKPTTLNPTTPNPLLNPTTPNPLLNPTTPTPKTKPTKTPTTTDPE